jgi:hypothetical protein
LLHIAKGDPSAITSTLKLYEGIEGIEEATAEARALLARLDQLVKLLLGLIFYFHIYKHILLLSVC